jgi:hypothetical protein
MFFTAPIVTILNSGRITLLDIYTDCHPNRSDIVESRLEKNLSLYAKYKSHLVECHEIDNFFLVKNRYIEICVNTTDVLGADVTLQTCGRTEPPYEAFYVVKEN